MPIREEAASGIRWQTAISVFQAGGRAAVAVALARLLPPRDFGIVGYAMVLVEFLRMFSVIGVGPALIQRASLTERHLRVGLTLSLLFSSVATAGVWLVAPWLALGESLSVLRTLALTLLLGGLGTVSESLLTRQIDFRRMFYVEVVSYLPAYGLVAIPLAVLGYGAWSLVAGAVAQASLRSVSLSLAAPHPFRALLAQPELGELLHFGVGNSLARIANYCARSADVFLIGRFLGPAPLGIYLRASTVAGFLGGSLSTALGAVLFPLYARVQEDPARLKRWHVLSTKVISLVSIPSMVLLAVIAPEVIRGIFGPAWVGATTALRWLALAAVAQGLITLSDALVRAKGQVYKQLWRHSVYAVLVTSGAMIGLAYGIEGAAIGVCLAASMMLVMMTRLVIDLTGGSWREFASSLRPGLLLGAAVVLSLPLIYVLRRRAAPDLLIVAVAAGVSLLCARAVLHRLPATWLADALPLLRDCLSRFIPPAFLHWMLGPPAVFPEAPRPSS